MDEIKNPEHTPQKRGEEVTLDNILNECKDAPGYVLFVGILGRERDARGFNFINFKYRRYNFSFEDTKNAIAEFKRQYDQDAQSL